MTDSFAVLIRTDGQFRLLDWPTGTDETMKVIYTAVDCTHFDAVHVAPDVTMWVDDEGMVNGSTANVSATWLYALHQPPHQMYYGHALFTGGADRECDVPVWCRWLGVSDGTSELGVFAGGVLRKGGITAVGRCVRRPRLSRGGTPRSTPLS